MVNSFPSKFSIDSSSNAAFTLASAFFPFIPFEFIKALAPPAATATPAETRATVPILTPTKDPLIKLLSIPLDRLIQTSCKGSNINNISLSEDNFEIIKNTSMRKTIAARLVKSKNEAPHFYLSLDCNLDKLLEIRASINTKSNDKYKISVNDMIIKAASASLIKVPKANASWEDENTKYYKNTDISVAVAIDGGLITPIVRNVQSKGLYDISSDMKYLSSKAKEGKLLPAEYIGGSFSISNLGMFGIKQFSAVINPPQGAILAVGAGERKAIVINENISIATVMSVTLSCDHRVIDGAVGAEFLSVFKEYIENPSLMLL